MPYTTLIDAAALARLLGRPGVAVLDCRFDLAAPAAGREAWLRAHIPGARHADLDRDLSGPRTAGSGRHPLPSPQHLAASLGALGVDNDCQVVAYDQANGVFAARLWWLLRSLGHTAVAVLDGGLDAWSLRGGALQSGPQESDLRRFEVGTPAVAAVDSAAVLAAIGEPARLLVDARAAERYAGEVEPIDPVAGHVPGAVNHPFTANLGAEGRFLPQAELRQRWQTLLAGRPPEQVTAMCGSGVTACHHLLALEVAGLPGASLYAGSWSEWIQDPSRPIATGRART